MSFQTINIEKKGQLLTNLSDEELIQLILQTGENPYYGELYDRYANKVYGKCIQMIKDKNMAQDLAQDILVKAFLKLNTFKGNSKFASWLFQVTYTHCIDFIRKQKRVNLISTDDENEVHLTDTEENQDSFFEKELLEMKIQYLTQVLDQLNPEDKMLLLLKYQDGLSISEMAENLDLKESATKMKLKRVRDKAKNIYDNLMKGEINHD